MGFLCFKAASVLSFTDHAQLLNIVCFEFVGHAVFLHILAEAKEAVGYEFLAPIIQSWTTSTGLF